MFTMDNQVSSSSSGIMSSEPEPITIDSDDETDIQIIAEISATSTNQSCHQFVSVLDQPSSISNPLQSNTNTGSNDADQPRLTPIIIRRVKKEQKHAFSSQTSQWFETTKMNWQFLFNSLIRDASGQSEERSIRVKNLIQRLIDDKIPAEEFFNHFRMDSFHRKSRGSALKKVLPYLRHSLMMGEITIHGVRPPSPGSVPLPGPSDKQVQVTEDMMSSDFSPFQLKEEISNLRREYDLEKSVAEHLRKKLSSLQSSHKALESEFNDYVSRACKILQDKDDLIRSMQTWDDGPSESEFKEYVLRARRILKDNDDLVRAMETWNDGPCSNLRSRTKQ